MRRFLALVLALAHGFAASAHEKDDRAGQAAGVGARSGAISPHPRLNVIAPAPDFELRDPSGTPVRLSDLRGQVVVLAFIYTSCTTACPILGQQMARLQKRVTADTALRGRVMLLSVSVDPSRDSAAALASYASALGADPAGWKFLRAPAEALAPVLGAYGEWTKMAGGELDHPARVHLIDGDGRTREIYSLAFFDPRQVLVDIRSLTR